MANEYVWKDLQWNSAYNKYWRYPGHDNDLKKCFKEVFNLDFVLITTGTKTEVKIENNIPLLILHGGAVVSIGSLPANTIVCMKKHGSDSSGEQERTSNNDGKIILNGSGDGMRFYFGEVSIGIMKIMQTYLFNGQQLDALNSQTPYLNNIIEAVSGVAQGSNKQNFSDTGTLKAYSDVKKDYNSSITGNTVSKELLNQIGVNKITIPRYKISENNQEYHFECLSFPSNRVTMTDDDKKTGQLCHDGDLQLASDEQLDAKYWSTTPHVYPEFVWDEWSGVNSRTSNEIDIKIRSDMLQVNGVQWELKKDDRVVVYRRSGTLTKQQYLPDIYWNSHAFTIDGHEIKDTIGENTWEGYQIDFNVDSYVVRDNIVLGRKDTYGNYEENNVFTTPLKNDFINVWKTETKNIEISLDHNTQNSDRQFLRGKTTLKFQLNDFPYFFYKDPITNMQLTTSENYEEFKHWYSGDERISGTIIYKLTTLEGILDKQYNLFNINTDSTTKVIKHAGNSYSMEYHKTRGQYYSKLYYDPGIGSGYTFELDVAWKLQPTNFKTYGYLIAIWRNGQLVL